MPLPGWQPFIWGRHRCRAQATYPRVGRSGPLLLSYLVLLRVGFALPAGIAPAAVRSYRTFSPLPRKPGRYVFCGTFRGANFERAPPAVSRHAALWRPDFPPAIQGLPRRERLPIRQASIIDYRARKTDGIASAPAGCSLFAKRRLRKPDSSVSDDQPGRSRALPSSGRQRGDSKESPDTEVCRVALEVGTHSPGLSRLLSSFGHVAIVTSARQAQLSSTSSGRDDRTDARMLAPLVGRRSVSVGRQKEEQSSLTPASSRGDPDRDGAAPTGISSAALKSPPHGR